jgi:DNA-binding helix-hairpin-helix protein with protein kinase domain
MTEQQDKEQVQPVEKSKSLQRKVTDRRGMVYTLKKDLGQGGQGLVCTTDFPNVLVKVAIEKRPEKLKAKKRQLEWLMRQDLDGLKIARPQEIIAKPGTVVGYVMELMDGLEPLVDSIAKAFLQLAEHGTLEGFRKTGGLKRRLLLLQELASTLADLHARGYAYGDLSPANIFVSISVDYHQLWLIDCDNICVTERVGRDYIYTPGYAAPEVIRQESGVNASTDCWSFAVIALKLLTLCHPFESGLMVEDGDPEEELEKAARGELPWIYDQDNDANSWAESGIPIALVTTKKMRELFDDCFSEGIGSVSARPSMATWAEAVDDALSRLLDCSATDDCGFKFIYNTKKECGFCGNTQLSDDYLLLRYYFFNDLTEEGETPWIKTASCQVLNLNQTIELHLAPLGTDLYKDSPMLCSLVLREDGLIITPSDGAMVELQRASDDVTHQVLRAQRLKTEIKKGGGYALHLKHKGVDGYSSHPVWKFKW